MGRPLTACFGSIVSQPAACPRADGLRGRWHYQGCTASARKRSHGGTEGPRQDPAKEDAALHPDTEIEKRLSEAEVNTWPAGDMAKFRGTFSRLANRYGGSSRARLIKRPRSPTTAQPPTDCRPRYPMTARAGAARTLERCAATPTRLSAQPLQFSCLPIQAPASSSAWMCPVPACPSLL